MRVVRSCFACAKLDWWSIAERGEVIGVLVGVSGVHSFSVGFRPIAGVVGSVFNGFPSAHPAVLG